MRYFAALPFTLFAPLDEYTCAYEEFHSTDVFTPRTMLLCRVPMQERALLSFQFSTDSSSLRISVA